MKKKKRIISYDTKVKAVERVHDGESKSSVSRDLKVSVTAVCDWVLTVERKGFEALYSSGNYKTYSNQFRINMVKSFLKSSLSMNEFTRENSLGSHSNLQRWLSKYKDGTLLEKLNREKLMNNNSRKKARKFDTKEKIDIVLWTLSNQNDYAAAAQKFHASYQQVNNWTKKYKANGVDGLKDRRGKAKDIDTMSELELLKMENKKLKKKLEERQLSDELLKKYHEIEKRHRI